ncbi:MAG TPA: C80 family cysteine peptidase [Paraburkholderia sp.]|jgi:hypothetical protein|nr:C80 family cysteine peptidase [Paraburkholderia sp.]
MAKTILLTWRNMLGDPALAAAVPRMADEDAPDKPVADDAVPPVPPAPPAAPDAPRSIKPLAMFVPHMEDKHRGNAFEIVFFDGAADHPGVSLANHLRSKVPADPEERLKLYISGHGGVGIDYITDDTQSQRISVNELATLLAEVLAHRATVAANSAKTQINMVSCLFARTPDGAAHTSPAARLHRRLIDQGIYVDLIGRTEEIVAFDDGRKTVSVLDSRTMVAVFGKQRRFYRAKAPYTKVLHTVDGDGVQSIQRASYGRADLPYVSSDTREGRQLLWAEHTVSRIVNFVQIDATGRINDARERKLAELVDAYYVLNLPELFKTRLEALVDGSGTDEDDNFLLHRGRLAKTLGWPSVPRTATFIRSLLATFPPR